MPAAGYAPPQDRPDFDQHYNTSRQTRTLASYESHEEEGRIYISDPVWGKEIIGDQEGDEIFLELYRHPVFQRLAAIEQLTLPKIYATMPGSVEFTRWEHVWGSVVFVRKMLRQAEEEGRAFDPREKINMQVRTLLSDAKHTVFSHLGDWLRQTFGGPEDSHDMDQHDFFEGTGINAILRRHGIDPQEVTMPEGVHDFVECPDPDLCTDRVDYGCREIARWVDPGSEGEWKECFSIDVQNRLIMKDKQMAQYFALAFGLLATEHWSHPVHRLQLQLFAELVKGAVLDGPVLLQGDNLHPFDKLYTIDADVMAGIRSTGPLNHDLHAILLDIARAQRRIFAWGREGEIQRFLTPYAPYGAEGLDEPSFPHPLESTSWDSEYSGVKPQNIELIPVESTEEVADFETNDHTYDMYLPSLKVRGVDPLYYDEDGTVHRVSEDPQIGRLIAQHRQIQAQAYVARIHLSPDAAARLHDKIATVQKEWDTAVSGPRTPESTASLYDNLRYLGGIALTHAPHPIRLYT